MQYNPLPFQQKAISLVCEKPGSALLLDPGMGKTAITLAAHCVLQHHKAIQATLVIVPLRPMYLTWPNEVAKWEQFSHLKVSIIHGTAAQRFAAIEAKADIYLINPENTEWLTIALAGSLDRFGTTPGLLAVDESTRFKNGQSKRFKALKTILPLFPRRTILTGTPAPQSIEDLFAQMNIVDDGKRLGRYITHFRKLFMYSTPLRIGGGRTIDEWHVRPGGAHMVAEAIKDVALRLQAEDYLTMPDISYNVIPVELPKAVRSVYKSMADDLVAAVGDQKITAVTAAAATMKLRQITNGWAYSEDGSVKVHDAKLDALADLVEEQQGTPLLVAVAFLHEVPAIRERLKDVLPKGTPIPYLGGGVSKTAANDTVARWNDGQIPVLLVHPTSVAHGLNLQAGGHAVCWFGLTWNLEEHIQTNARVYRQGQTKPVVIHYLTAKDTVDESIAKALVDKSDLQSAILNRLKGTK
jgi:SNF2 family DNA or RNA helicase